jgi:hypothetical protein
LYDVADASEHKNWMGVSGFSGEGNAMYDVYSTIISFADYGVREIMGIGRILDYIIVFGDSDILKLNVSGGTEFSWSLEETLQNIGCVAPDSITYIMSDRYRHSGYYYMAQDGVRVFDGNKSVLISEQIHATGLTSTAFPLGVADHSKYVFGYDATLHQLWLKSQVTAGNFKYDLVTGAWSTVVENAMFFDNFITTYDGRLLGSGKIQPGSTYQINVIGYDGSNYLTDQDGSAITAEWVSKEFDMGAPGIEKILQEVTISYKSDTGITFQWYIDGGSVRSMNGTPFPAKTSVSTVTAGIPIGERGEYFKFRITATSPSTNTYLQIDKITVSYTLSSSERFE